MARVTIKSVQDELEQARKREKRLEGQSSKDKRQLARFQKQLQETELRVKKLLERVDQFEKSNNRYVDAIVEIRRLYGQIERTRTALVQIARAHGWLPGAPLIKVAREALEDIQHERVPEGLDEYIEQRQRGTEA